MTTTKRFSKLTGGLAAVFAMLATAAAADEMTLELNKVEQQGDACRIYLVFDNPGATRYDAFRLDFFMFDPDGIIQKRLAVEAAPLRANKTTIKLFDAPGLKCELIARIMLNDVIECATEAGPASDCVDRIAPTSKAATQLVK